MPIESGISRAVYDRNGPGNGILIDMSYNIPDECPQHTSKTQDSHKRRNVLLNNFRVMKKKIIAFIVVLIQINYLNNMQLIYHHSLYSCDIMSSFKPIHTF